MKQVIIILFIILLLYIIYRCFNCSKKEGFVDRNRKNKVIDLVKGVNGEGDRRDIISEGISLDDDLELVCMYDNKNIYETKLEKDEYILGSMIYDHDLPTLKKNILENPDDHFPHKLNYVYNSSDKKTDYFKTEKDLTQHKDIKTFKLQDNNVGGGSKDGDIVSNYLRNKKIHFNSYSSNLPTEEGCHVLLPTGCANSYYNPNNKGINEWIIDNHKPTSRDAMTNEKTCESRTNTWNDWCKIDNSKTHFVKKRDFHLLELLGFIDPNIKNKMEMDKYVLQKFYKYNNTGKYELDENRKNNLFEKVTSEIKDNADSIHGGNNIKIPFLKEEQLYSFLKKCGVEFESMNKINLLDSTELQLNIYGFTSDDKDINKKINTYYDSKKQSKETKEYKDKNVDLLYKLFKFQTDYLYKHKDINKIVSQFPNIKTDVNLYYHYYEDEIKKGKGENNPEQQQFRYLGGLVSQNEKLNKYEKLKILKIPQRCLKEISDKEYIDLNTDLNLVIHPIYKTILKKRPEDNIVYELKPCIQLQTKFRQQQKYYNDIKGKCKQYSKVNIENPIFTKTSEQVNTKIKHDIIKRNAYIINEKKQALEELKKEDIIKKNINRAYNRGKLNKYLNQKEENLYMLNKKINNSKNSIDLNFYYSGDMLNDCFDNLKDSSLSKEDKISKCKTIIENNLEKQKKEQEKEILTTCKQTDYIRKDEVPCWGCTDVVMN